MRKIINGRKYDTETARLVAEDEGRENHDDPSSRYRDALYQKRTGEYFLEGWGGPNTKWAQTTGTLYGRMEGQGIMPLAYEEARDWMEGHMDADEYEAEFGDPDEQEGTVVLSVRVSAAAKAALDRACARSGERKGDVVDRLLLGL